MTEPIARDCSTIVAGRIAVLVNGELGLSTARLTNHREALQSARIWVRRLSLPSGTLGSNYLGCFLLFV